MTTVAERRDLSNPFTHDQLELLERLTRDRVPFYVRMQISSFEARVSFLMNQLANGERNPAEHYLTFFCCSTSEAISGAIKLVRHNGFANNPDQRHRTAVFDPSGHLVTMFDPLSHGSEEALVPGLIFFDDLDAFTTHVDEDQPESLLLRHPEQMPNGAIDAILRRAAKRGIFTVLDESSTDLSAHGPISARLETSPDVITFGENLSDHRVPAGCFLMKKSVSQVWNNSKDYNLHSNTWGGNSASLATVLSFLETTSGYQRLPKSVISTLQAAADSHLESTRLYAAHCSPKMASMLNLAGLNKNIRSAYRTKIDVIRPGGTIRVIDASGTYGVNLQGHNPDKIVSNVISRHDPTHDYWKDLENLLQTKTGLPRLFPAVSGATAVEAAIVTGMLANAPKRKVIALEMGFSGKTLLSLIGTSRERVKKPFRPLYRHVNFIDPFGPSAEQELQEHLEMGDVGLVIMETIQGDGGVRQCPANFLEFVQKQKQEFGFLIAIDEVQTGMYRTGSFLNHTSKITEVDIIAMGKAMSNNVFPVAGTMVSEEVYQRALETNGVAVDLFRSLYRCQFGAQIAIHAIESGQQAGLADLAKSTGEYFQQRLRAVAKNSQYIKEVRGEGLMIGIEFDREKLPRLLRDNYGGLLASRLVNDPHQPVLVAFSPDKPLLIRFAPPLCITTAEIDAVIETTRRALNAGIVGLLKPIVANVINTRLGRL